MGIAGIFIGLVVLSFIPSNMIDIGIYDDTTYSYNLFFENLLKNANLNREYGDNIYVLYIPPYENLPNGAVFVSSDKNFKSYIGHLDEESPVIYSKSSVFIHPPICHNFIKKFEEYARMELKNADLNLTLSAVSSCLKANGLIGSIDYEENIKNGENQDINENIPTIVKLYIEDISLNSCLNLDENVLKFACPIVSSTVFSIALSLNKIVSVEDIEIKGNSIILTIGILNSIEEYMW